VLDQSLRRARWSWCGCAVTTPHKTAGSPEAALIPWRIGKALRLSRHGETGLDVKAGAVSGVRWSYFSTIALIVANVAYTAIASRLISPSAFGLVALANLVVFFLQFFARAKTRPEGRRHSCRLHHWRRPRHGALRTRVGADTLDLRDLP